jgi:hypothetical protein
LQYGLQVFRDNVLQCILDPVVDPGTCEEQAGYAQQQERTPQEFAAGLTGRGSRTAQPSDLFDSRSRRFDSRVPTAAVMVWQMPGSAPTVKKFGMVLRME